MDFIPLFFLAICEYSCSKLTAVRLKTMSLKTLNPELLNLIY
jgi:hypothetical protein